MAKPYKRNSVCQIQIHVKALSYLQIYGTKNEILAIVFELHAQQKKNHLPPPRNNLDHYHVTLHLCNETAKLSEAITEK